VGVIGGYQEGGDTPSVSYSVHFGTPVQQLYQQAVAAEAASGRGLAHADGNVIFRERAR
jgi:hypothetical protein